MAVVAPTDLVEAIAPAIVTGNTCIVVTGDAVKAIELAEVFATSDLPGGVVNILTGYAKEVAPWLASHDDVNGLDLTGVADAELAKSLEVAAADTLKRVLRPGTPSPMARMTTFLETKTVWHPKGV